MMKFSTRLLAGILALALAFGLCACSPSAKKNTQVPAPARQTEKTTESMQSEQKKPEPSEPERASSGTAQGTTVGEENRKMLAGDGYYVHRARTPIAFEDMDCPQVSQEEFEAKLHAISDAAEKGSAAAFHSACYEAQQAMNRIETAYMLAMNENAADPMDEETADRMQELESFANEMSNLYYGALHEVSLGENQDLLRWEFEDDLVEFICSFDLDQAEQLRELEESSTELILEYEKAVSEEEPDYDSIAELYVKLVKLWKQEAELEGYESFADYAYEAYYLRNYTPADAEKIWETAKEDFAPLLHKYIVRVLDASDTAMEQFAYDGSDTAVLQALAYGAGGMSPEVKAACDYMIEYGLYDIAYSETKTDQSYTVWLSEYEVPFIFSSPYGDYYDFCSLFHEFGHFVADFYSNTQSAADSSDLDLSELQSQGMEVMFFRFYDEIFGEENADAIRAETLINLIDAVVEGAMYDEFQQKVFGEENLTAQKVQSLFLETCREYGINEYPGLENHWMDVMHNFEAPFYYVSYAVSAIPALELFIRQEEDAADAMDTYLRISAMSSVDYYLSDALRKTGLANTMVASCGDVLAEMIEQSGALDVG